MAEPDHEVGIELLVSGVLLLRISDGVGHATSLPSAILQSYELIIVGSHVYRSISHTHYEQGLKRS
jgi:hypothetical protein